MTSLEIRQFACRADNYGVLIHDAGAGLTASIDAPETTAIEQALAENGWTLTHIMTTHHHFDHVEGHAALKAKYGCTVIAPASEAAKIPGVDITVKDGDRFAFGNIQVEVIETPGHTLGQVNYFLPEAKVAFTGDTLFALGCGRIFEGSAAQMWGSMQKLMRLPPETAIYCGHEYTLANAKFAVSVDPENAELRQRASEIEALRAAGKPTLPTTLAIELRTNPFLRANDPAIRAHLGMEAASDEAVFTEIRRRKDHF
ncbi:MAG: hydroxyacylglutathione hydrolase [Rhizobiales bacterium]|nr:hydroxyacylglutathione hydrolase [Hyphomicrobiales bacterium]